MISLLRSNVLLVFILFSTIGFGQSTLVITSCDTLISNLQPALPSGSSVVTIKSANNTRLGFKVEYFNYTTSISIYDGNATSSPLITTLGDITIPNQKFGGQSTGSSITLRFFSSGPGATNYSFKIRIVCVQTPENFPALQPLQGINAGKNLQSADFDKDGDLDFLGSGKIFRNDSYFDTAYKFERQQNVIEGWSNVNMCSADFDNDGYKDIFITGLSSVFGGYAPQAAVYKNNGNGSFSLLTSSRFVGAFNGGCSIVDYNHDGKPDICYTGSVNYYPLDTRIFKVYLNNGNMRFAEANISLPNINGLLRSGICWADSDGDGDMDLLINGDDGTNYFTSVFTNEGNNFIERSIGLSKTSNSPIIWADVNMDGKPDIVNTGLASVGGTNSYGIEIFQNNGNNSFTRIPTNLPLLWGGSIDLADYDNDKDLDFLLCGLNNNGSDAAIYKNKGAGQFERIEINQAKGSSTIKWYDFNKDGKKDVILAGTTPGSGGYFIKNMGADSFKIVSFPFTASMANNAAVAIEDFNNDGLVDVLSVGKLEDVDCNSRNASTLVVGKDWRFSPIPLFTEVVDLNIINPATKSVLPDFNWSWGDFDSDGKLDVLASHESANTCYDGVRSLRIFRNNGNNNFSLSFNSEATALASGYAELRCPVIFDIDNDKVNEMYIPGHNGVFKYLNNQWREIYKGSDFNPGGLIPNWAATADYNNDGYLDMAVSWSKYVPNCGTTNGGISFFKNNQQGKLVVDTANGAGPGIQRRAHWVDVNRDGFLDLVSGEGVFENRKGKFFWFPSQLPKTVDVTSSDMNQDGFVDLITTFSEQPYGTVNVQFNEQGTFFFAEKNYGTKTITSTPAMWDESALSYDLDNDGDNDIIYTGNLCGLGATVLVNEGTYNDRLIHVTVPNGGEQFLSNTQKSIEWYGNQVGSTVKIEMSKDSGVTWQTLAAAVPSSANGGRFSWMVNDTESNTCLIKITDNSNNTYTDKSNAVFSIIPGVIGNNRDTTICLGDSVRIGKPASGSNLYSWASSDGIFVSSNANPVVKPTSTTTYFLTVTNSGIVKLKDTMIVSVGSVQVSVPDTLISTCIGNSLTIGVNAQGGNSYEWSSIPQGFSSSIANLVINPIIKSDITYKLVVTNIASGCTATAMVHVIADSCQADVFSLYPNPARTFATIVSPPNTVFPCNFILADAFGNVVLNYSLSNNSTSIDIGRYATGIYFYTIRTATGQRLQSGLLSIIH